MARIVLVYDSLKSLANKEQKGYITPTTFNNFAGLAQMNVFNELFTELVDVKRLSRQGFELGRDKSIRKQKEEALAYFVKKEVISINNHRFPKPRNLSKIISIRVHDIEYSTMQYTVSQGNKMNSCELLYDIEKANYVLGSNLSTPTHDFPVALISEHIEVFPTTVQEIELTYYRTPGSIGTQNSFGTITQGVIDLPPFYASTVNPNYPDGVIPDYSAIRDFMIPDHFVPELVAEMAKLMGIRLRDSNVYSFGEKEEAAE